MASGHVTKTCKVPPTLHVSNAKSYNLLGVSRECGSTLNREHIPLFWLPISNIGFKPETLNQTHDHVPFLPGRTAPIADQGTGALNRKLTCLEFFGGSHLTELMNSYMSILHSIRGRLTQCGGGGALLGPRFPKRLIASKIGVASSAKEQVWEFLK